MSDDVRPEPTGPSRRERNLARRRRRYRLAALTGAAMIVGGTATVAAFTLSDDAGSTVETTGGDDRAGTRRTFDDDQLPELAEVVSDTPPRPLSADDPLRVWVGGDSLAGALGPALGEVAGATGVVDVHVDYKVSSGLATNVRNWRQYAPGAIASEDAEVVIFMVGANDVTVASSHDRDADGVADWEPDYRSRVAEMMDLLLVDDRVVLWIGSPTMRNAQRDRGALEVNRVMREEAAKRAPDLVYVDAYRLFAGADGGYSDTLEDAEGDRVRVRIDDGVHFTPAGAQHLADAVFALLEARYGILAQADPAHAREYTIRHGGSSEPGSGGSGGSRRTSPTSALDLPDETAPPTSGETTPTTAAPPPPVTTETTAAAPPTTLATPPTTAATTTTS